MLCTKTRFETEAQGNQEMAYYTTPRKDDVLSGITFFSVFFYLVLWLLEALAWI